ncbi:MAG: hypothetical protein J5680_05960 [Neisseriaceae bacterium]|nr:hypothetical protein [Neisseriaceae bacterium]
MSSGLVLPCGKTDFLIRTTLCDRPYLKYSSCCKAGHNPHCSVLIANC